MGDAQSKYLMNTPLGGLRVYVRINGQVVDSFKSDAASCLVVPVVIGSNFLDVTGTEGVVLRCSTRVAIRQLTFECRWEDTAIADRGRPECDTGVNALRWIARGHTVLVATEDAGALQDRMHLGKNMTQGLRRCLSEITPELDHLVFSYKDDGFIIRLTEIPANEVFQLHYIVAWNTHPEPESEATWLKMNSILEFMSGLELPAID